MEFNQFVPLLITFLSTLVASYITIKITITEIKKDLYFLRERLESELIAKVQHESQAKDDMKEVKDDLKQIFNSMNDIKINFAKMEARSEGKDEVITELKDAVKQVLQQR